MVEPTLQGFSREFLRSLFIYDPLTGLVTRRVARSNRPAGEVVGTLDGKGYLHVSVNKRFIRLHRLAWFLLHGTVPPEIDHKNRTRTDNREANLRVANRRQQAGNASALCTNTSGFRGVSRNSRSGKWHAQIKVCGKQRYLGRYETPEEAAEVYRRAAVKHFGEFARVD